MQQIHHQLLQTEESLPLHWRPKKHVTTQALTVSHSPAGACSAAEELPDGCGTPSNSFHCGSQDTGIAISPFFDSTSLQTSVQFGPLKELPMRPYKDSVRLLNWASIRALRTPRFLGQTFMAQLAGFPRIEFSMRHQFQSSFTKSQS